MSVDTCRESEQDVLGAMSLHFTAIQESLDHLAKGQRRIIEALSLSEESNGMSVQPATDGAFAKAGQSKWRESLNEQQRKKSSCIVPRVVKEVREKIDLKVTPETPQRKLEEKAMERGYTRNITAKPSSPQGTLAKQVERRRRARLYDMFKLVEKSDAKVQQEWRALVNAGKWKRYLKAARDNFDRTVDVIMAFVIIANAIFIGLSVDNPDRQNVSWLVLDVAFTLSFIAELLTKICIHGVRRQFCGPGAGLNIVDACIILVDSVQMGFLIKDGLPDPSDNTLPSASLFRVVRLMRIGRILRLVRSNVFADLLAMVNGIGNGLPTLAWAIVVYFLIAYVMSLVCRDVLGNHGFPNVEEYFDSLPNSVFTVFRCSFGDCTTGAGMPIPVHMVNAYGGLYAVVYTLFLFFITIGLFNIISAIFVDSTMSAAAALNAKKQQERLSDQELLARSIYTIVRRLLASSTMHQHLASDRRLSDHFAEILDVFFSRDNIKDAIHDELIQSALKALEIDPADHGKLADILDPDRNGYIGVLELVSGLQRLRGAPRRSDIITVDLMIRSVQEKLDDIMQSVSGEMTMSREETVRVVPTVSKADSMVSLALGENEPWL